MFDGNVGRALSINADTVHVSIENSTFTGSQGERGGAVYITSLNPTVTINNSIFAGNSALSDGGAIYINGYHSACNLTISYTVFTGNRAGYGWRGGGIYVVSGAGTCMNSHSNLTGNSAEIGSAIWAVGLQTLEITDNRIDNNTGGARFMDLQNIDSGVTFSGMNTISNNNGSLYIFNSQQVLFNGPITIESNHGISGGAIEAVQSQIHFNNSVTIRYNTAIGDGGGLTLIESSLFVNSPATISHNTANEGGAIYAY